MHIQIKKLEGYELTSEDLITVIREAFAIEFQNYKEVIQLTPIVEKDELLSKKAAMALLSVSSTTLHNWNVNNILPAQRLGGRIYYAKSVIMNKLNNVA